MKNSQIPVWRKNCCKIGHINLLTGSLGFPLANISDGLPGLREIYRGLTVVGRRLVPGPPVQLFQPFSQFIPAGLASLTMLAVLAVHSQEGQQLTDPTSHVHPTRAASL